MVSSNKFKSNKIFRTNLVCKCVYTVWYIIKKKCVGVLSNRLFFRASTASLLFRTIVQQFLFQMIPIVQ